MNASKRVGNKSFENVVRTDERYGHDGFWLGPCGRDYGALLENPKPYQIANLYPDQNSSYWMATVQLPSDSTSVSRGLFEVDEKSWASLKKNRFSIGPALEPAGSDLAWGGSR